MDFFSEIPGVILSPKTQKDRSWLTIYNWLFWMFGMMNHCFILRKHCCENYKHLFPFWSTSSEVVMNHCSAPVWDLQKRLWGLLRL